jgi:thioredoxin 1
VSIASHDAIPCATSENFDRLVVESPVPVLVNFQTSWVQGMVPLLGQLADAFAGQLRVVQVNIATDPDLAARFKIRAVPTLLIFKSGVPVEFIVGTVPARFIFEMVCQTLGTSPKATKARCAKNAKRWSPIWPLVLDSSLA